MNNVILMGRLTKDPEVRYSQNGNAVASYTLAVDRRFKKDGEPDADFIRCVVFGKSAEFAEKYLKQGMRITIRGRIQTGSYTNTKGDKVYTTDVVVEEQEFAQNKEKTTEKPEQTAERDEFMTIPDDIEEELPFDR